jgi:hypothetical protein
VRTRRWVAVAATDSSGIIGEFGDEDGDNMRHRVPGAVERSNPLYLYISRTYKRKDSTDRPVHLKYAVANKQRRDPRFMAVEIEEHASKEYGRNSGAK